MVRSSVFAILALAASTLANPLPLSPDPAGEKNVGNGAGGQFIGGACLSAADCASGCCATLNGAGICSGVGAQFQAGKQGCGFGGGGSGATAPPADGANNNNNNQNNNAGNNAGSGNAGGGSSSSGIDLSLPGSQNVGLGNGAQFITGQCLSDADCASGCCAKPKGFCSGPAVAFDAGKQGCGFVAGVIPIIPASTAAQTPPPAVVNNNGGATGGATAVTLNADAPGSQNVGKGNGAQFITGQCISDADCASGCCAKPKGACSAPLVAFDNGKQGCGFVGSL